MTDSNDATSTVNDYIGYFKEQCVNIKLSDQSEWNFTQNLETFTKLELPTFIIFTKRTQSWLSPAWTPRRLPKKARHAIRTMKTKQGVVRR